MLKIKRRSKGFKPISCNAKVEAISFKTAYFGWDFILVTTRPNFKIIKINIICGWRVLSVVTSATSHIGVHA
jgi:hypothetical protein